MIFFPFFPWCRITCDHGVFIPPSITFAILLLSHRIFLRSLLDFVTLSPFRYICFSLLHFLFVLSSVKFPTWSRSCFLVSLCIHISDLRKLWLSTRISAYSHTYICLPTCLLRLFSQRDLFTWCLYYCLTFFFLRPLPLFN